MPIDASSSPTALLRDEHELILRVVGALERVLGGGRAELDGAALDGVDRCLIFFRLYVDAFHHGKEEDLLFPALGEHGLPADAGPVAMMLEEHVVGRSLIKGMTAALGLLRGGDSGAHSDLDALAYDYSELIRAHIDKENNILFDMADLIIEGSDLNDLCVSYEDLAARDMEEYTLADLEALAQKILVDTF